MRKKRPEFPSDVRRKVLERSGNRCERCSIDFDDDFKGELHHITPIVLVVRIVMIIVLYYVVIVIELLQT